MPRPVGGGGGSHGRPEVEDLPGQVVVARSSARLGLGGVLAVGAVVILVAAGFGALGGRPDASPGATAATGPTRRPPVATPVAVEPMVTPWARCTRGRTGVPGLGLTIDGVEHRGRVEVLRDEVSPGTTERPPVEPARIEVRADALTQLWIDDGSCAVSWTIELVDFGVLDTIDNPSMDPALAAQNRFDLILPPDVDGDLDLKARLTFPDTTLLVTWPVHLTPLPRPRAELRWGGVDIPLVEGCDLYLFVMNRYDYPLTGCEGTLSNPPPDAVAVRAGKEATFSIPGWVIDSYGDIVCIDVGDGFVEPHPGACTFSPLVDAGVLTFGQSFGPADPKGTWLLQLQGCANTYPSGGGSQVCGTWYANIRFR